MNLGFLGKMAAVTLASATTVAATAADWSTTSFEYRRGRIA